MIHTIYLDLDDVLNTLTPFLLRHFGVPEVLCDYSSYPGRWDIVLTLNRLLGCKYTRTAFWQAVPRRVWAEAPRSAEFCWLLRACKRIAGRNLFIVTRPTRCPECSAGKMEWIQAHLPKWMHENYFLTRHKERLARPGTLLIDDNEENCCKFEAAGGAALRFPRPWNAARGQKPRPYLAAGLSRLAGQKIL